MSKKKKNGSSKHLSQVALATAIINLLVAIINLIKDLLN